MSLASNLYDMMVLRQMTIRDIQEKSGISKAQIGLVLKGKCLGKSLTLIKGLANAVGCTPGWLLRK